MGFSNPGIKRFSGRLIWKIGVIGNWVTGDLKEKRKRGPEWERVSMTKLVKVRAKRDSGATRPV